MSDAVSGAGDPASKVAPAQLAMFVEKASGPLREGEDFLAAGGCVPKQTDRESQVQLDVFYDLKHSCHPTSPLLCPSGQSNPSPRQLKKKKIKSHPSTGGDCHG